MQIELLVEKYEDWYEYEDDRGIKTVIEEMLDDLRELRKNG